MRNLTLLLLALYSEVRKIFYIGAHLRSLLESAVVEFFFEMSQLSIRSGAYKLFRRFLNFSQFLTAISRKLWRHLATEMRTI